MEYLESGASHVVQIGERTKAEIASPDVLLKSLFKAEVVLKSIRFTLDDIAQAKRRLPPLPSSTMQIISAINHPLADTRQVESAISRDPLITAHLIRLANSAAFSVREPARSLESAIWRIGLETTRLHVLALSIGRMYSSPPLRKMWEHALATVQITRQIARQAGQSVAEAALLSLVQDIGLLVMFGLGKTFESAYLQLQQSGLTSVASEQQLCGLNHAQLGAELLSDWNFPDDMCEAVLYHHSPSHTKSRLAAVLYLSESWIETNEDVYSVSEHAEALQRLGLSKSGVGVMRATLDSDLQVLRAAA